MKGYKVGLLKDVMEENGVEIAELYTDFWDEAPRVYRRHEAPNIPVFYRVLESVFEGETPWIVAVKINEWSISQIFNAGCWRITLEKYGETSKDVLDIISEEDEETFKVERYTVTYDGIATVNQYSYETDDPVIVAEEIRKP